MKPLKIVFVGATATGKSSIIQRYARGVFSEMQPSLSAALERMDLTVVNKQVQIHIWDTAGQDRYTMVTPTYYRSCDAVCLTLSSDQQVSLEKAQYWLQQIRMNADANIRIFLIYNKIDLTERELAFDIVEQFASVEKLPVYQTSAKTGEGIQEFFQTVSEAIVQVRMEQINSLSAPTPVQKIEIKDRNRFLFCCK